MIKSLTKIKEGEKEFYTLYNMDNELLNKLDELYDLIFELDCVKNILNTKNNFKEDLINLVNKYRINPTINNKKLLYENSQFQEYIKNETELNYLIMEINNKFKRKRGQCESN